MEVVENSLDVEVDDVLSRPLFCHLATASTNGPRESPLWFLWDEGTIWIIADSEKSYTSRIEREPRCSIGVVDFDPSEGRVEHVGLRGRAAIEPFDRKRARELLEKYLGSDEDDWPDRFRELDAERWCLIRFDPETVVARDQSYPVPSGIG